MKSFQSSIKFFVDYLLLALGVMTLFRVILLSFSYKSFAEIPGNEVLLVLGKTLLRGIQFDLSIMCYVVLLPFLFYKLSTYFVTIKKFVFWTIFIYLTVIQTIIFFVLCADIPLFLYSGNRITIAVFQWIDTPKVVLSMIVSDPFYCIFFILFQICSIFFNILLFKKLRKFFENASIPKPIKYNKLVFIFSLVFLFFGSRGNLNGTELKLKDSIVSSYVTPNQITFNPVFYLLRSYLDKISLMDDILAAKMSVNYLNSNRIEISPLARYITNPKSALQKNVVVVIMESMSANNLSCFGNKESLTPCLDSIAEKSLCFDNFYSSGIHTNNGIFSTLFSFPSFWRVRPLQSYASNSYTGFSGTLKAAGYSTLFFTTQDKTFDNIFQFMPKNNFDELISQDNYPAEKYVNTFGVADHTQFQYVVNKLSSLSNQGKPFFASVLTSSNHPPLVIPADIPFKPKSKDPLKAEVEYADWSIKLFLQEASKQEWFNNTVFVFLGDHGCKNYESPYDIYLSFNHIPLLIYAPTMLEPKHYSQMGGQIDVFPTVMGLLNFSYLNNTPGVDLLETPRPYIFFSGDDKMGCIDNDYLFVFRQNNTQSLYHYRNGDTKDYIDELKNKADSMRNYSFALTQTSQWCILNNKTGFK